MSYAIPTLDGSGWLSEPGTMIDRLFAYYNITQHSQTILFREMISSSTKDVQICMGDLDRLPDYVNRSLNRLFSAYFDQVQLEVRLDEKKMNDSTNEALLLISGTVITGGKTYDLSRELTFNNGKFSLTTEFKAGGL